MGCRPWAVAGRWAVAPGGGGHSLIWAIRGHAAGQGMVFWPRCPKQGIQFDLPLPYTGSEPVLNRVWYYEPRDFNPDCEQDLMIFLFNLSAETQQLGFRRIEHHFSHLNGLLNNLNSRLYILENARINFLRFEYLYACFKILLPYLPRVKILDHYYFLFYIY